MAIIYPEQGKEGAGVLWKGGWLGCVSVCSEVTVFSVGSGTLGSLWDKICVEKVPCQDTLAI